MKTILLHEQKYQKYYRVRKDSRMISDVDLIEFYKLLW